MRLCSLTAIPETIPPKISVRIRCSPPLLTVCPQAVRDSAKKAAIPSCQSMPLLYRRDMLGGLLEGIMQKRYSLPAAIALAVVLAGCNQAPPPAPDTREADAKAIRDFETGWMQAFAT